MLPPLFLSQVPRRIPVLTFISPCLLQLHGGTGKRLDSRVRRAQWRMQLSKCPRPGPVSVPRAAMGGGSEPSIGRLIRYEGT